MEEEEFPKKFLLRKKKSRVDSGRREAIMRRLESKRPVKPSRK